MLPGNMNHRKSFSRRRSEQRNSRLPLPWLSTFKILCSECDDLSLATVDGDPRDDRQQWWYKDMEHARPLRILCQSRQDLSLNVRDGTAVLARADDKDQRQVGFVGHKPESVDVALLWTQSEDLGEGFHGLRSVSDVGFVLDAANAVPEARMTARLS